MSCHCLKSGEMDVMVSKRLFYLQPPGDEPWSSSSNTGHQETLVLLLPLPITWDKSVFFTSFFHLGYLDQKAFEARITCLVCKDTEPPGSSWPSRCYRLWCSPPAMGPILFPPEEGMEDLAGGAVTGWRVHFTTNTWAHFTTNS